MQHTVMNTVSELLIVRVVELGREGFDGTEHEWTTGTYEAWDEDTHTVVEKERTYCSRCGVSQ